MSCPHIAASDLAEPTPVTTEGCAGCLEEGRQDWVHLRLCLSCGYVGCCDSSPGQHANRHFGETRHPVIRSFEAGESWRWCFIDEAVG